MKQAFLKNIKLVFKVPSFETSKKFGKRITKKEGVNGVLPKK